jgi:hypothetical protein
MIPRPAPITDSPLFWVLLFGSVGLVMLTAVEPKYIQRQERIVRMQQSRERARPAVDPAGENRQNTAQTAPAWQPIQRASLRPLMLFMAGVLLVAMIVMHVRRQQAVTHYRQAQLNLDEGEQS